MTKRDFGLAGVLATGSKIFYESLFSQLQAGRLTDLLCAVGGDAGVHVPALRALLNAALMEACRCQGLFASSINALDPITVEFGADATHGALSVQFSIEESLEIT